MSDNTLYPDFCLKASKDISVFANFRQDKVYRAILEHIDSRTGRLYLNEIKKIRKDLLDNIDKIKENDLYGNPDLHEYDEIGKICSSTLRYAKVSADLLNLFGPLEGYKIAEIGVGYGGQCRVINSVSQPAEYTLIDIEPALLLAQCYLNRYILHSTMRYKTMNELVKEDYDLVISNYAFTELRREIQDVYLEKMILNSKRGYITYNEITPEYFKSYKKEELLKIIPHSRIIEEMPLTHPKNCIILWSN
ncbi:MAG: putative sugar O-methyltransferase [Bacteroidales bacterium]|nr:putative sugar O-methyltransferase [Bacteroidales bacterium]